MPNARDPTCTATPSTNSISVFLQREGSATGASEIRWAGARWARNEVSGIDAQKVGKGMWVREALDDVVYTKVEGDTERRIEGKISKKIVDRIGDTTGNGEEWMNRKSKPSFFVFLLVKVKCTHNLPWRDGRALHGVASSASLPEKAIVSIAEKAGLASEPVWAVMEKGKFLDLVGIRAQNRPVCSDSLHRIRCPGPILACKVKIL